MNDEKNSQSKTKEDYRFKFMSNLGDSAGTHSVTIREKSKPNGKKASTYVHKLLAEETWIDPYIASIEAVASELYNFICPNICPKTRVVTQYRSSENKRVPSAVVSKNINGYKVADKLTEHELETLTKNNLQQLAGLFVAIYVLEENDLHGENWGINDEGNVVKIDNDRTIFDISSSYQGLKENFIDIPIPPEAKAKVLEKFPHETYSTRSRFAHISVRDIMMLPIHFDCKPNNHPIIRDATNSVLKQGLSQTLYDSFSSKNPDKDFHERFKDYKYYYLTKSLLLNQRIVKSLADAHSFENDESKSNQLASHYQQRVDNLKETLLSIPEYQDFVINYESKHNITLQQALETDINQHYNAKYYYKPGGSKAGEERFPDLILRDKEYTPILNNIVEQATHHAQLPKTERELIFIERKLKDSEIRLERETNVLEKLKQLNQEIESDIKKTNHPGKLEDLHEAKTILDERIKQQETAIKSFATEKNTLTQEKIKTTISMSKEQNSNQEHSIKGPSN